MVQWINILLFLSPKLLTERRMIKGGPFLYKPAAIKREGSGYTCFRQVPQRAAEGAPLQALAHGVAVVQTGTVHVPVSSFLLQARALRHAGPHHPLLLLQLGCGNQS